jgi:hypothetical protein
MGNPNEVFWVGLWIGETGDSAACCLGLLVNVVLSSHMFPGLGAYLPCPGRISKPVGAKNPGTEAGTCHRFLQRLILRILIAVSSHYYIFTYPNDEITHFN